ncbi:hypothetical protein [Symbiobacterium thermophilum]|nr:hypothetical protein [Symbiobacterium thermophilum]
MDTTAMTLAHLRAAADGHWLPAAALAHEAAERAAAAHCTRDAGLALLTLAQYQALIGHLALAGTAARLAQQCLVLAARDPAPLPAGYPPDLEAIDTADRLLRQIETPAA